MCVRIHGLPVLARTLKHVSWLWTSLNSLYFCCETVHILLTAPLPEYCLLWWSALLSVWYSCHNCLPHSVLLPNFLLLPNLQCLQGKKVFTLKFCENLQFLCPGCTLWHCLRFASTLWCAGSMAPWTPVQIQVISCRAQLKCPRSDQKFWVILSVFKMFKDSWFKCAIALIPYATLKLLLFPMGLVSVLQGVMLQGGWTPTPHAWLAVGLPLEHSAGEVQESTGVDHLWGPAVWLSSSFIAY